MAPTPCHKMVPTFFQGQSKETEYQDPLASTINTFLRLDTHDKFWKADTRKSFMSLKSVHSGEEAK